MKQPDAARGIVAYGAYVPCYRLSRSDIAAALGNGLGAGSRAVASFDEDTTSMGVEAARTALRAWRAAPIDALVFSTAQPAYLDKSNATAIHAALDLPSSVLAFDAVGATRSGVGALRLALSSDDVTLLVSSELRSGDPGGADESDGGDASAAMVIGSGPSVLAELVGATSATSEFLDRWRLPGWKSSKRWEERFGETAYTPLAEEAIGALLKEVDVDPEAVDHLIVVGLHRRAVRRVAQQVGVRGSALGPDLTTTLGCTGAAELGLGLAEVLDRAAPGQLILVVSLADGADALMFRTTDAIADRTPARAVADALEAGRQVSYTSFLTWRGYLDREAPRRPEPESPAAPVTARNEAWKFGFTASRCNACGTRHLPPSRVCLECGAADDMMPERLADSRATIATFTVDHLAFSLNSPVVVAVIDFDGGGRFQCEITDVDPAAVAIGDRVEMTFRRVYTAPNGVHNYFWKARPSQPSTSGES